MVSLNWLSGGASAAFAARDHVAFDDAAANKGVTAGSLAVGRIVFSNDTAYTLNGGGSSQIATGVHGLQEVPRFEKWGAGKLTITGFHSFTGDVLIAEGCVETTPNGDLYNAVSSALGNPRVPRTATVSTNATLALKGNDIQGQFYNNSQITIHVDGGTLSQDAGRVNGFGPLILENATLSYSNRFAYWGGFWPTFGFNGPVTFKGTNAYTLANYNSALFFGAAGMSDVIVEDITQNADADVTISMPITDGINWYKTAPDVGITGTNEVARPSQFRKQGAGTLRLASGSSTFSGDIDIAEGVLQVPAGGAVENKAYSGLGNPQVTSRQMLVRSGGELYFMASDTLGQLASSVKMATVVSNATLRLANNTCSGFGPLTLYNANVIYNGGTASTKTWGVMGLGGTTVFDGTNAYTFATIGSNCRFNLGYALDFAIDYPAGMTNYNGKTEFVVRDITTNANVDVSFEAPLQDIPSWGSTVLFKDVTFKCGLLKSGTGTLRLASTDNTYSGPTVVTQGVLCVDGSLTTSAVTIESNGYLGGTGQVTRVTVQAGAGFEIFADQTEPLKIATLAAASGGVIRVRNPDHLAREGLRVPFARVTAFEGPFNPRQWTVVMDGVDATPNLNVWLDVDNTLYAHWAPQGTLITLF